MNDYSLKDKVVIVTGATKGMGLASCKALLKMGAKVAMIFISDTENARKVTADLSKYHEKILLIQADITKPEDRQRIINETVTTFHKIDVLVNNAGVPAKNSFLKENETTGKTKLNCITI